MIWQGSNLQGGSHEININAIDTTNENISILQDGANSAVLDAYNRNVDDLQEERRQAMWLINRMFVVYDITTEQRLRTAREYDSVDRNYTHDVHQSRSID